MDLAIFFNLVNEFIQMNIMWIIVTFIFMVLDVISGLLRAWITKTFSSTKMREGFGHKLGFFIVMMVVAILQVALLDPNFTLTFDFPLFNIVCGFIIFMEVTSILENAVILNPQLDSLIGRYFDNNKDPDNVSYIDLP